MHFLSSQHFPYLCLLDLFQVRYHPTCPGLLASGSLDHEVRLWDANTAECIGSRDFCNYSLLSCYSAMFLVHSHFTFSCFFLVSSNNINLTFFLKEYKFNFILPLRFILFLIYERFIFFTDRPIASIAFHAQGEVLAVASGHKVKIIFAYKIL